MVHARAIPMVATTVVNNDEGCPGYYFFSTDPFQDKNICSAVIVFNLGLVFHLRALQDERGHFSTDPFQEKNICSAVIVFNLGLVFHLWALQDERGVLLLPFLLARVAMVSMTKNTTGYFADFAAGNKQI